MSQNIIWFKDCSYKNKHLVGGKCSSLGELYNLSNKIKDMIGGYKEYNKNALI